MRSLLLVSLVLNVLLAVALMTWLTSTPPAPARLARTNANPVVQSNFYRIVKTNVLVRPRVFTWQEVESPDYAIYVQNLRELGMPESTVRDIISADVEQIFSRRTREELASQDLEWWRTTPSTSTQSNQLARLRSIETEREELLIKLLGADWNKDRLEQQRVPLALAGPVLGAMPESTKTAVQNIAARSADRLNSYIVARQSAGEIPAPAELARMREETRQQLASALTPQQLEEFLLRYSDTAGRLRQELNNFEASPEEFRALFRAIDGLDRQLQLTDESKAGPGARETLEKQRLTAFAAALGPERWAAFQASQSAGLAGANSAPEATEDRLIQALMELQRAGTDEINRLKADTSLTEAERQRLIRETEAEQQKARGQLLAEQQEEISPAEEPPAVRIHALEPGETLGLLAVRYGIPISAIRAANPGVDINRASPGTAIQVPYQTPPPNPARRRVR